MKGCLNNSKMIYLWFNRKATEIDYRLLINEKDTCD